MTPLLCFRICLHDSENVAFCVFAVGHITDVGYGHLGSNNLPTRDLDFFHCILKLGHAYRIYCRRVHFVFLGDGAVDSRLLIFTCAGQPIFHAFVAVLFYFPAENFLVEGHRAFGIFCRNLKVNYS